jgi:hypothetical protein
MEGFMTESERDLLMPFLRKLVQTRTTPGDEAASTLIDAALGKQPNASYLLVQRALTLERDLAAAQRRINQLEGKALIEDANPRTADFLNLATSGWGEQANRNAPASTSKKLYDFFKDAQGKKEMDFESRAVAYLGRNSGKVWLFILVLTAVVVFVKESSM